MVNIIRPKRFHGEGILRIVWPNAFAKTGFYFISILYFFLLNSSTFRMLCFYKTLIPLFLLIFSVVFLPLGQRVLNKYNHQKTFFTILCPDKINSLQFKEICLGKSKPPIPSYFKFGPRRKTTELTNE